ncbi:nucleotide-diphospho-sugar transferase [Xylaria sp. CBS 124048]|nr:nucleotide-diphospho-sugar transferase [Xylaria sp. CBS 124048]
MAAPHDAGEDVYATLLLTDTYLPGALVLAHSLRHAGTTKKLAALVTVDSVSADSISELQTVYHYIIPVPKISNAHPANLQLMNRPDLQAAFTKINLWKLTQFRKIVYVDADVVAYRAPDELFDIAHPFSAAPDIGWPDLFNTGVMVLTPNMDDYSAMMALAERGISFDGADQGLINTYFGSNFNRISFTYNVTPSAHYQYTPAYRHFESSISMVHFIGANKPWFQGRQSSNGSAPYDQMVGRWWAVYDRFHQGADAPSQSDSMSSWDAQRHPPPTESKPEALNFPSTVYEMSKSSDQFVAPQQYSGHQQESQVPPMFPWETYRAKPSRLFWDDQQQQQQQQHHVSQDGTPSGEFGPSSPEEAQPLSVETSFSQLYTTADTPQSEQPATPKTPTIPGSPHYQWTSYTRTNVWDEVPEIQRYVEVMQKHRVYRVRTPGILSVPPSPGEEGSTGVDSVSRRQRRVTDFPSAAERPGLPGTTDPNGQQKDFWIGGAASEGGYDYEGDDGSTLLPSAVGVPRQSDWDPMAQLQKLARKN